MNTRSSSGISLLGLLVSVALVAILLALLFPSLQSLRQRSAAMQCVRQLNQWSTAIAVYIQDHNGRFPSAAPWGDGRRWNHSLAPLTKIVYNGELSKQQMIQWNLGNDINGCPAHRNDVYNKGMTFRYFSYAMNSELIKETGLLNRIKEPSRITILIDATERSPQSTFQWSSFTTNIGYKHQGKANILFVDGHVEQVAEFYKDQVVPE